MNPSQRAMRLVAIADEINKVRCLIEVGFMAASEISDTSQAEALMELFEVSAARLKAVSKDQLAPEILVA